MAKIRINGDTSGYVDLAAPAVAGATSLTLPLNGFGKVLQVVQSVKTDVFSTTSTSFVDVTGWTASITPTSTTSKIFVQFGTSTSASGDLYTGFQLLRGSTAIGNASASGSRTGCIGAQRNTQNDSQQFYGAYLDSPSTTLLTTYKVQVKLHTNTQTLYIGTGLANADNVATFTSITTMTLTEIMA